MASKSIGEMLNVSAAAKGGVAAEDVELEGRCPLLFSLLTCTSPEKGRTRRVCTMSVFAADGVWKASLNERDRELVLWASSDALASLPDALEAQLALDPIPWRSSSQRGRGGRG